MTSHGSRRAARMFSACRSVARRTDRSHPAGGRRTARARRGPARDRGSRPGRAPPRSRRRTSRAAGGTVAGAGVDPQPPQQPGEHPSCSGPSSTDSGVPGVAGSSSSADVSPAAKASSSRTAPCPSQTRSPAASSRASSCTQPTLSTTSPWPGLTAGATHEHSPPGSNGGPSSSDHRRARLATRSGSAVSHPPRSAECAARRAGIGNAVTRGRQRPSDTDDMLNSGTRTGGIAARVNQSFHSRGQRALGRADLGRAGAARRAGSS